MAALVRNLAASMLRWIDRLRAAPRSSYTTPSGKRTRQKYVRKQYEVVRLSVVPGAAWSCLGCCRSERDGRKDVSEEGGCGAGTRHWAPARWTGQFWAVQSISYAHIGMEAPPFAASRRATTTNPRHECFIYDFLFVRYFLQEADAIYEPG